MEPREEEELQLAGCGEQAHGSGVPQIMGSSDDHTRQRRYVEPKVDDAREGLFGTAALLQHPLS